MTSIISHWLIVLWRLPPVTGLVWAVWRLLPGLPVSPPARAFSLTSASLSWTNLNTLSGAASTRPWVSTRDTRTTFSFNQHSLLILLKVNIRLKIILVLHSNSRPGAQDWATLCEDLFRHSNLWQNHQGQQDEAERHGRHCRRDHGAPHWLLHHQRSGDTLLCCQDFV